MNDKEYIKEKLVGISTVRTRLHGQEWEFQIWPIDKLTEWNKGYEVEDALPGYFAFGSDGGLEMLTVELSTGIIYSIPFIPMESEDKIKVSDSIMDLVKNK